jgi:SAM-dependent methyltransferase
VTRHTNSSSQRAANEIAHGRLLAEGATEATWGWGTPAGQRRASRRADLIATAAHLSPVSIVLEIGCGTGLFTEKFAASGARIVAVDISPDLLRKAGERRLPADRVRFLERRVEDLDISDAGFADWTGDGFDAVIGSSVLHHLDLAGALCSCRRMLKPGGMLAFAEPNLLNPQVFLERNVRSLFPYVSDDEWAINRWSMKRELRRAGFAGVRITPFDWLHPSTPKRLIPLVASLGRVVENLPGAREFAGSVLILAQRPDDRG